MNVVELTLSIHVESFIMGLAFGAAFPKAARSVLNTYRGRLSKPARNGQDRDEPTS
jgi:hypothetical protein